MSKRHQKTSTARGKHLILSLSKDEASGPSFDRLRTRPDAADDLPYRHGVGVMLFNRAGKVFVAQRIDQDEPAWQMPQGGIDRGEDPLSAARRELWEEIGTDRAQLMAMTTEWLRYDLPAPLIGKAWKGKYRGQKQKWFAMRFTGRDGDIRLDRDGHPEFSAWRWTGLDEVPGLIVAFKRPIYRAVVAAFRHLAVLR